MHEANPSSTVGVIAIMEEHQKLVPRNVGGQYLPMAAFGDGMSVERMIDAKLHRMNCETDAFRLEGLCPSPQEFHHHGNVLQVRA